MHALKELDKVIAALGTELYSCAPIGNWVRQKLIATYTPSADVGGHDYIYELDNFKIEEGLSPGAQQRQIIRALTRQHWQSTQDLGQPRWYKMTVTVERTGKFSVDFEYKDDYHEGDIMKRG
jgi:hypothetical protein